MTTRDITGLTDNEWTGTFTPTSDHPIVIDTDLRGGLHYVEGLFTAGVTDTRITSIPAQRLQLGMLAYIENTHTIGTIEFTAGNLYQLTGRDENGTFVRNSNGHLVFLPDGDTDPDTEGVILNQTDWSELETGGEGGLSEWAVGETYEEGDVVYRSFARVSLDGSATNLGERHFIFINTDTTAGGTVAATTNGPAIDETGFWERIGANAGGETIVNLGDPSNDRDAATKLYVDNRPGGGSSRFETLTDVDVETTVVEVDITPTNRQGTAASTAAGSVDTVAFPRDTNPHQLEIYIASTVTAITVGDNIEVFYSTDTNRANDVAVTGHVTDVSTGDTSTATVLTVDLAGADATAIQNRSLALADTSFPQFEYSLNTVTRVQDHSAKGDAYFGIKRGTDTDTLQWEIGSRANAQSDLDEVLNYADRHAKFFLNHLGDAYYGDTTAVYLDSSGTRGSNGGTIIRTGTENLILTITADSTLPAVMDLDGEYVGFTVFNSDTTTLERGSYVGRVTNVSGTSVHTDLTLADICHADGVDYDGSGFSNSEHAVVDFELYTLKRTYLRDITNLHALGEANLSSGNTLTTWSAREAYLEEEIVIYENNLYRAANDVDYTAPSAGQPANANDNDSPTEDTTNWHRVGGSSIFRGSYTGGNNYLQNDIVWDPGNDALYVADAAITDAPSDFDATQWTAISDTQGSDAIHVLSSNGGANINVNFPNFRRDGESNLRNGDWWVNRDSGRFYRYNLFNDVWDEIDLRPRDGGEWTLEIPEQVITGRRGDGSSELVTRIDGLGSNINGASGDASRAEVYTFNVADELNNLGTQPAGLDAVFTVNFSSGMTVDNVNYRLQYRYIDRSGNRNQTWNVFNTFGSNIDASVTGPTTLTAEEAAQFLVDAVGTDTYSTVTSGNAPTATRDGTTVTITIPASALNADRITNGIRFSGSYANSNDFLRWSPTDTIPDAVDNIEYTENGDPGRDSEPHEVTFNWRSFADPGQDLSFTADLNPGTFVTTREIAEDLRDQFAADAEVIADWTVSAAADSSGDWSFTLTNRQDGNARTSSEITESAEITTSVNFETHLTGTRTTTGLSSDRIVVNYSVGGNRYPTMGSYTVSLNESTVSTYRLRTEIREALDNIFGGTLAEDDNGRTISRPTVASGERFTTRLTGNDLEVVGPTPTTALNAESESFSLTFLPGSASSDVDSADITTTVLAEPASSNGNAGTLITFSMRVDGDQQNVSVRYADEVTNERLLVEQAASAIRAQFPTIETRIDSNTAFTVYSDPAISLVVDDPVVTQAGSVMGADLSLNTTDVTFSDFQGTLPATDVDIGGATITGVTGASLDAFADSFVSQYNTQRTAGHAERTSTDGATEAVVRIYGDDGGTAGAEAPLGSGANTLNYSRRSIATGSVDFTHTEVRAANDGYLAGQPVEITATTRRATPAGGQFLQFVPTEAGSEEGSWTLASSTTTGIDKIPAVSADGSDLNINDVTDTATNPYDDDQRLITVERLDAVEGVEGIFRDGGSNQLTRRSSGADRSTTQGYVSRAIAAAERSLRTSKGVGLPIPSTPAARTGVNSLYTHAASFTFGTESAPADGLFYFYRGDSSGMDEAQTGVLEFYVRRPNRPAHGDATAPTGESHITDTRVDIGQRVVNEDSSGTYWSGVVLEWHEALDYFRVDADGDEVSPRTLDYVYGRIYVDYFRTGRDVSNTFTASATDLSSDGLGTDFLITTGANIDRVFGDIRLAQDNYPTGQLEMAADGTLSVGSVRTGFDLHAVSSTSDDVEITTETDTSASLAQHVTQKSYVDAQVDHVEQLIADNAQAIKDVKSDDIETTWVGYPFQVGEAQIGFQSTTRPTGYTLITNGTTVSGFTTRLEERILGTGNPIIVRRGQRRYTYADALGRFLEDGNDGHTGNVQTGGAGATRFAHVGFRDPAAGGQVFSPNFAAATAGDVTVTTSTANAVDARAFLVFERTDDREWTLVSGGFPNTVTLDGTNAGHIEAYYFDVAAANVGDVHAQVLDGSNNRVSFYDSQTRLNSLRSHITGNDPHVVEEVLYRDRGDDVPKIELVESASTTNQSDLWGNYVNITIREAQTSPIFLEPDSHITVREELAFSVNVTNQVFTIPNAASHAYTAEGETYYYGIDPTDEGYTFGYDTTNTVQSETFTYTGSGTTGEITDLELGPSYTEWTSGEGVAVGTLRVLNNLSTTALYRANIATTDSSADSQISPDAGTARAAELWTEVPVTGDVVLLLIESADTDTNNGSYLATVSDFDLSPGDYPIFDLDNIRSIEDNEPFTFTPDSGSNVTAYQVSLHRMFRTGGRLPEAPRPAATTDYLLQVDADGDTTWTATTGEGTTTIAASSITSPDSLINIRMASNNWFLGVAGTTGNVTIGGASRSYETYTYHGVTLYYIAGITLSGTTFSAGTTDVWTFGDPATRSNVTSTNSWNAFPG